jgi:hypothetical protein
MMRLISVIVTIQCFSLVAGRAFRGSPGESTTGGFPVCRSRSRFASLR